MNNIADDESLEKINHNLLKLICVAATAGVVVGVVGGSFHWLLVHGQEQFAYLILQWKLHGVWGLPGWLIVAPIAGASVGLARWLIVLAPSAAGSGVQHVEAVMRHQDTPAPLRVLPIKFFGGLLSIIPGLALGREGPTVQMAAVIGSQCGRIFGLSHQDKFLLYTAVAGAGLAVAFNAPIAGVAFVVEEVARKVTTRQLLTTIVAVATSVSVFRGLFGNAVAFEISSFELSSNGSTLLIFALFGIVAGVAGVLYNKSILLALELFTNVARTVSPFTKAAGIGAVIGLVGYWQPFWVGGGESQIHFLMTHGQSFNALILLLLVRWILGPLSYSPGLPGGLFAPLLLIGATLGGLWALAMNSLPVLAGWIDVNAFVLVGMAAFFTAVVRAPFTGVILLIEMSANVSLTPALMIACATSAVTASLMRADPIYDSLRARMPKIK